MQINNKRIFIGKFIMKILSVLLTAAILIGSCKPKDGSTVTEVLNKDSAVNKIQPQVSTASVKELLLKKWNITDAYPSPESPDEKLEMLKTVIEFTSNGKVMVTSSTGTNQEATFTLTMDDKYILSTDKGKDKSDSISIEEINANKLVLLSFKDKTRITLAPQK